jgi:hypothetical protein
VVELGETQRESAENGESKQSRFQNPLLWGTIMAILAIVAPFSLTISFRVYETIYSFSALIWHDTRFSTGIFRSENFFGYFLPILCLRLVPAFQIANYYRGNSTRKQTALIILIGDGILLPGNIIALISSLLLPDWLPIPLPIQMIVGLLILWRAPLPEPTRPWVEQEEPKNWWIESKKNLEEEGESV